MFKELGEKESIKNLAAAVITGGVLAGMGFQVLPDQPNVGSGAQEFGKQLLNNLQIQGASTLINTTIQGGSFEDGLKDALLAALVNSIAATTASGIGDLSGDGKLLNDFTNKLAHAIAGCALGAAHSGSSGGCAGGAIGATVGEMMTEAMLESPGMNAFYSDQDKVYLAGLLGGLGAALAGGDAEQIAAANWAGSNAAANNALGHATKKLMQQAKECAASPPDGCVGRVLDQAKIQDEKFQKSLEAACTGANASFALCNIQMSAAASGLNDLELMRGLYGRDDPQIRAAYQSLVDKQRTDIGEMQRNLDALRIGESPLGVIVGELAPNVSPADGAHAVGAVAGTVAGMTGSSGPKVPSNLQPFTNPPQGPVVPSGWVSRPGKTPGSTIYYPPGTDPAAPGGTYIRVMPPGATPVPGLENGYWISVKNGQPINPATGGTGSRGDTHVPLPPNTVPPLR